MAVLGVGQSTNLQNGMLTRSRGGGTLQAKTDSAGHFKFSNVEPPYLIVATDAKEGYAEIFTDQLTDSFEVQLIPWGRVEGTVMLGDKPGAKLPVTFQRLREASNLQLPLPKIVLNNPAAMAQMIRPQAAVGNGAAPQTIDLQAEIPRALDNQLNIRVFNNIESQTDAQGHFVFEHIVPGHIAVMRVTVVQHGNMSRHSYCYGKLLDVAPGETTKVVLGGNGRPVIGRVKIPEIDGKPVDLSASEALNVSPTRQQNVAQVEGEYYTKQFSTAVAHDGSFRLEDIPPGNYTLSFSIIKPGGNNAFRFNQPAIAAVTKEFSVPEFEAGKTQVSDPLDLGELVPPVVNPNGGP